MSTNQETNLTVGDFLSGLRQHVSQFDARLILDSALVGAGLQFEEGSKLRREEAESICLELIRKGGPAFQVGSQIYRQNLQ